MVNSLRTTRASVSLLKFSSSPTSKRMIPTAIETVAEIRFSPSRALGSSAPAAPAPNPSASSKRIDGSRRTCAIKGAAAASATTSPSSNSVRDWLSATATTNLRLSVLHTAGDKPSRLVTVPAIPAAPTERGPILERRPSAVLVRGRTIGRTR